MDENILGKCCTNMEDAINKPPNSMFRVDEFGVLWLSVGYVRVRKGWKNKIGWFDSAVIFCPFCGRQIQDPELIKKKFKG